MDGATYGVKPGQHIPGTVVHRYLTDYAKRFGVFERTRLNTKVESAEPSEDGGWLIKTTTLLAEQKTFKAKKLIVATGLTSEPYVPQIPGMYEYQGTLFHIRDFAKHAETVGRAKKVVVLGGAKSAWDVSYSYATAGAQVDMVIRESGHGPAWISPSHVSPLKRLLEVLVNTRFLTWFSPCAWGAEDGYGTIRNFLHSTSLGRVLVSIFWKILNADVIGLNKYDSHPETKKLKPWDPAYFVGSSLSILNYPINFFDLVKEGKVRVNIDDISRLGPSSVILKSGKTLDADVVVLATGWKKDPSFAFLGAAEAQVGLSHPSEDLEGLAEQADKELLTRFPFLKNQPERKQAIEKSLLERFDRPFRMYRFIVPPETVSKRNIAFAGLASAVATVSLMTAQALWISAFFDNKLSRMPTSQDEIRWLTVLHTQCSKWRHPTSYGPGYPDFAFDGVPYIDMLLKDLNLESHRKTSKLADIFDGYGPRDYAGIVEEWQRGHGST